MEVSTKTCNARQRSFMFLPFFPDLYDVEAGSQGIGRDRGSGQACHRRLVRLCVPQARAMKDPNTGSPEVDLMMSLLKF